MTTADRLGSYRDMSWPQMLAIAIGVLYALIGVVGFFITGFDEFFGHTGEELLGFEINGFHNLVHIFIGVAGIVLARTLSRARTFGWVLAVAYGAAFVYGLFAVAESWDFLSLNWADNWLHLVSAFAGLVVALGPVRTAADRRTQV